MKKHIILGSMLSVSYLFAGESLNDILDNGQVYGNAKYYYIQTDKQNTTPHKDSSAKANSIGGQLGFKTGSYRGFNAQATLMTTNGFNLGSSVDTSILARDNGIRLDSSPSLDTAQESFTVLGELFLAYATKDFDINYGRQILDSPLIDDKEVRMLPSTVQGSVLHYTMRENALDFEAAYLTDFKQRTSDKFINIVEHALGGQTKAITGSNDGSVGHIGVSWNHNNYALNVYDYYAQDFLNSFYADLSYKGKTDTFKYTLNAQGIMQRSIGNANDNLTNITSITGGKKINAEALSLKATASLQEGKLMLGYSYITSDNKAHDSLVLPWDGTPLYTNMITSNNLFVSNYGKGLTADSIYIGGTQSFKMAYTQGYDFTGVKGIKTTVSYMVADNDKFTKGTQQDFNVVLGYKYNKNFSIDLKGIFVQNNTSAQSNGDISQLDDFQQYRVIANYTF